MADECPEQPAVAAAKPAMTAADLSAELRATWCVPGFETPFWSGKTQPYCVVIPVINEGERIGRLLARMATLGVDGVADIILIDGGSTDGSLSMDLLQAAGARALLVKTGAGKLSAQLRCAYAFALEQGYAGIVTIDGNDKDDPQAIPRFIEALKSGFDFVQGSRFVPGGISENTPRSRTFAIRWMHAPLLSLFSGFPWTDTTQGFRAYSRTLLLDPRLAPFREVFDSYELLAYMSYRTPRLGYRCVELPTTRRYPATGAAPTKISGFRGNFTVLRILFLACLGRYDPETGKGLPPPSQAQ